MKKSFLAAVLFLLIFGSTSFAQPATGNVVVVTKQELALGPEFSGRMLDSLAGLYHEATMGNNPYVIDYKILRHWWGHDNTEFVVMYSVKNLEDMEKAQEEVDKLFEGKWTTQEDRDAFDNAYSKLFTGKHSDEIYREVK